MKTNFIVFLVFFLIGKILLSAELKDPGSLVLVSTSNATEFLEFSFGFEKDSYTRKSIWGFKRFFRGEIRTDYNVITGMTGGFYGYNCDLRPSSPYTNSTMMIRIEYNRMLKDGGHEEGTENVIIPASGSSSGHVGIIYYISTWTSNDTLQTIGSEASPQSDR